MKKVGFEETSVETPRRVLKSTKSLCPVCKRLLDSDVVAEDGQVFLEKSCPEHGFFRDVYWSDLEMFLKFDKYFCDGNGVENPQRKSVKGCPFDCGLCENHKTTTILANIDLTNRCNMRCPICFANANVSGRVYEPSFEQVRQMLQTLRDQKPVPCPAVQFAGGEPTVREDFVDIVRMAKEMGFAQVQVATNGLLMAHTVEYCRSVKEAGLNTIYLQFDGTTPEPYYITRGGNFLPHKHKVIENCRQAGLKSITLVPTLVRGVNDGQMGDIVRFAFDNSDVVRSVNVQPISFAGRVEADELKSMRITIPDLFRLLEEQTDGQITRDDFYPVPFVVPISKFVENLKKKSYVEFTIHPHCGAGTYLFEDEGKIVPITRFFDVEGMLEYIAEEAGEVGSKWGRLKFSAGMLRRLSSYVDSSKTPEGVDVLRLVYDVLVKGDLSSTAIFHRKTIFLGVMHFQDCYNFDVERVSRCGIHYALPDGRIVPFCTYNNLYRDEFEAAHSKPFDQ
ncbi:MAG: tetraether lipid synthase Tes [Methermicoccaceae archaeon]